MRVLLDTHTFIWWDSDPLRLTQEALAICQNPENLLLLSVASVWEIQIKLQLGKLKLVMPLPELIVAQERINKIEILPVELEHVLALDKLPARHKDPFDRLLILAKAPAEADKEDSQDNDRLYLSALSI